MIQNLAAIEVQNRNQESETLRPFVDFFWFDKRC